MSASSRAFVIACCSVALVTAAQVGMRWSMMRLPPQQSIAATALGGFATIPVVVLVASVGAYAASMLCWLAALKHLPLNRAYPILSLSYALVYLASVLVPGLGGSFSMRKSLGVLLVLLGVALINARRGSAH